MKSKKVNGGERENLRHKKLICNLKSYRFEFFFSWLTKINIYLEEKQQLLQQLFQVLAFHSFKKKKNRNGIKYPRLKAPLACCNFKLHWEINNFHVAFPPTPCPFAPAPL